MTSLRVVKTNFTAGEISPLLLGRGDLRAYENGAKALQNITIHPTGGLSRRRGLYYIDTALGAGRLISFTFSTDQNALLVLTDQHLTVYKNGLKIVTLLTPWRTEHIPQVTWTQSADTVLLCHPDIPPQKLLRISDTQWQITPWAYVNNSMTGRSEQPFYKYAGDGITLTPSAMTGTIIFTASEPVFNTEHLNTRIRFVNKEALILSVSSSTVVSAQLLEPLSNTAVSVDWSEQAFSAARGWPICAVFHQDRLVIVGSRDLPNRLWLSCTGDLWNFSKGTGLDSESIEFGLFSDQVNAIRALFSSRHLQVFTSGAEYIVTGVPLTPTNIQVNRQTRIGSPTDRYIPPIDVDGATIFVGRTQRELREFLYTDAEQAYQASDLALLARHFFNKPVDQCFDPLQRLVFLPLASGDVATLTLYRTESVSAWSRFKTDGHVLSVTTVGSDIYMLIKRQSNLYFIERLDETALVDSSLSGSVQNPATIWSGLEHLNSRTVTVIADDVVVGDKLVIDNQITLDQPARSITVGLPYRHIIEPLPPSALTTDGSGRTMRMVDATFRLHDTKSFTLDSGSGLKNLPLRQFRLHNTMDTVPPSYTGDYTVRAFGWLKDASKNFWRIEQDTPLPFSLLGVTMTLKVND